MYGSKADNLIKLRDAGINVPAFTIISARDDVEHSEKLTFVSEGSASLYAVRSSCNLEDGAGSSFAGQFDTYLNVRPEEVPAKIKLCRESMYSDNVKKYMEYHHLSDEDLKMCVIVQEMADAYKAGVLFTSNPQGILNESVISVARGLGEGVVSGSSETTTYYYNNTDKVYYYEGREDLLSESEIDRLIDTSVKIKEILGEYLDIEYAFAGDRLYILQARPITTISGASPLILDNSNIVESYPGLSLPLTVSFVHMVYSGVFKGVSRRVLKNEKERYTELNKANKGLETNIPTVENIEYSFVAPWLTRYDNAKEENKDGIFKEFTNAMYNKYFNQVFASDFSVRGQAKEEYNSDLINKINSKSDVFIAISGAKFKTIEEIANHCKKTNSTCRIVYLHGSLEKAIGQDAKRERSGGKDFVVDYSQKIDKVWEKLIDPSAQEYFKNHDIYNIYEFIDDKADDVLSFPVWKLNKIYK